MLDRPLKKVLKSLSQSCLHLGEVESQALNQLFISFLLLVAHEALGGAEEGSLGAAAKGWMACRRMVGGGAAAD